MSMLRHWRMSRHSRCGQLSNIVSRPLLLRWFPKSCKEHRPRMFAIPRASLSMFCRRWWLKQGLLSLKRFSCGHTSPTTSYTPSTPTLPHSESSSSSSSGSAFTASVNPYLWHHCRKWGEGSSNGEICKNCARDSTWSNSVVSRIKKRLKAVQH